MNGPATTLENKPRPGGAMETRWMEGDVEELCSFVADTLASRSGATGTVVVSVPAPRVEPETFLRLTDSSPALLWAPLEGPVFAGVGAVHRLELRGAERLASLESQAQALWQRLHEVPHPACRTPGARLFGGLSFAPGSADAPPWQGFGDGSFLLPELQYCRWEDGAGLSVARRCEELTPEGIVAARGEVCRVLHGLASAEDGEDLGSFSESTSARRLSRGPSRRREEPTPQVWRQQVQAIRRAIQRGTVRKIVAARRLAVELPVPLGGPEVLTRLATRIPGSTRFAFVQGGATFLGATPERLIARRGLVIDTEALAGSISNDNGTNEEVSTASGGRGLDGAARRLRACAERLLHSSKDQLEHALVVQHIVERLKPLSTSLSWNDQPGIRELGDVLHLRTPIRGELRQEVHILRLVELLHPTPAVGGVPAPEALRWIADREAVARGWYAGPIGWFDRSGDGEFAVALRSTLLRGQTAYLYAGAGVVQDSDPVLEYQETQWKQRALLTALGVE